MLVGVLDNKAARVDYIPYIHSVGYMVIAVGMAVVVDMVAVVDMEGRLLLVWWLLLIGWLLLIWLDLKVRWCAVLNVYHYGHGCLVHITCP